MATSSRLLVLVGVLGTGWGLYLVAAALAGTDALRSACLGLLVVGTVTGAVWHARCRVEATAAARYRDGYSDGYVDGVADRRPRRSLHMVR